MTALSAVSCLVLSKFKQSRNLVVTREWYVTSQSQPMMSGELIFKLQSCLLTRIKTRLLMVFLIYLRIWISKKWYFARPRAYKHKLKKYGEAKNGDWRWGLYFPLIQKHPIIKLANDLEKKRTHDPTWDSETLKIAWTVLEVRKDSGPSTRRTMTLTVLGFAFTDRRLPVSF